MSFDDIDRAITTWMSRNGIFLLRISLGIVFLWFGVLKYFSGLSPAEALAVKTISVMSFHQLSPATILILLATWESCIGIGLLTGRALRSTLLLLFLQMAGTLTPLFLFPSEVFLKVPYAPTLEGQYIIKNLVLISAGLVIGATVRPSRVPQKT